MHWTTYIPVAVLLLGVALWQNLAHTHAKTPASQARSRREQSPVSSASVVALSPQSMHEAVVKTDDFELRDWFAFGSGCRARAKQPGDVTVHAARVPAISGRYRVRVSLPSYGIRPDEPLLHTTTSFARECGIRLAVYPAEGKKMSDVAANPVYRVNKPVGPRARLRSRLFVGNTALFESEKWYPEGQEVNVQEVLAHGQASTSSRTAFEQSLCEQPRIVGLDLSAAVTRTDLTRYEVTLAPDQRSVEIQLQFTACGLPTYSSHQIKNAASTERRAQELETQ